MFEFSKNVSRSGLARVLGVDRLTILRLEQSGQIPAGTRVRANRTEFTPDQARAILAFIGGVR